MQIATQLGVTSQADTLNAEGAGALLFADPEIVMALARAGEIPGTKLGKHWVFLREDVLEFLRKRVREDTEKRLREIEVKSSPTAVVVEPRPTKRRRTPPELPRFPGTGV
jgi:hypothetical protein